MKRERDLELRLQSLRTLGQAVVAMKSLSAHHFRAAREALAPVRTYRQGVDRIVRSTGASLPAGDGPRGLLVVGGELGFCGAYNAHVAMAAVAYREAHGEGPTFCVGHRAATFLRRRGVKVDREYPAPAGVHRTTEALLHLGHDVITDYIALRCRRFDALANRFRGVGVFDPATVRLLPIESDPIPVRPQPRYVSRERLGQLQRRLWAARREAGTQELIEVSIGARARRRRGA